MARVLKAFVAMSLSRGDFAYNTAMSVGLLNNDGVALKTMSTLLLA